MYYRKKHNVSVMFLLVLSEKSLLVFHPQAIDISYYVRKAEMISSDTHDVIIVEKSTFSLKCVIKMALGAYEYLCQKKKRRNSTRRRRDKKS